MGNINKKLKKNNINKKLKIAVWKKAFVVTGCNPKYIRVDKYGNLIYYKFYKKNDIHGWNIQFKLLSYFDRQNLSNSYPIQTFIYDKKCKNNRILSDDFIKKNQFLSAIKI